MIPDEVKSLHAERARLWQMEKEITKKIKDLKLRHMEITTGFKIGGLVRDKKGYIYKIQDVEFWDMDMCPHEFKAIPKRKDGSFGTAIRNLWMYEDKLETVGDSA